MAVLLKQRQLEKPKLYRYSNIIHAETPTDSAQQEFATQPLIRSKTTQEAWYRSTDCIWEGPDFLRAKQVLSPLYGADQSASSFFQNILSMRNVSYEDLIDELKMLSTEVTARSPPIEDKAQTIYTALAGMASSEPAIEAIRYGRPSERKHFL